MTCDKRWDFIKRLGAGGQGTVDLVRDKTRCDLGKIKDELRSALSNLDSPSEKFRNQGFEEFRRINSLLAHCDSPAVLGALKRLHPAADARDPERALDRMTRELAVMAENEHPNLLRIIDRSPSNDWYVSEYYPNGTLADQPQLVIGNVVAALRAIRPVVEGVALLHVRGFVHRDIKPLNLFVSADRGLILGDFGLVYFTDEKRSRLSATLENVGSKDWMPQWAMGMRLENVTPSFDVYCLAKVLWSLVAGQPFLRLWYFAKPEFNLEVKFPLLSEMKIVNRLLSFCIVEDEHKCKLPDANALLKEIDYVLNVIESGATVYRGVPFRPCQACRAGLYQPLEGGELSNSGISPPAGNREMKAFVCNNCGHVQRFLLLHGMEQRGFSDVN